MPEAAWQVLLQYGALGVMAAGLIVYARTAYKREVDAYKREAARADRLEAEVSRLNELIQERHIPALLSATQAVETANRTLSILQDRDRR